MKQKLIGIPLPVGGWASLLIALSPYILRGIGAQMPSAQPLLNSIAGSIESILTLGQSVDPVIPQTALAIVGGAALQKTEAE